MNRRVPTPAGVHRPGAVLTAFAFALYVIARSTGAGWVVVILCGLVALLVAGTVLPIPMLARVRTAVTAPRDATVGRPLPLTITLAGRGHGLRLRVRAPEGSWLHADAPCTGETVVTPTRRGVVRSVTVELRAASPLGLMAWRRRCVVTLDAPIDVGPRPTSARLRAVSGRTFAPREDPRAAPADDELTRGVREYVDGDPIRRLHWPASARTGTLMVRELEGPRRPHVVLVVDLRGDGAEAVASTAAGLANDALRQGALVDLATAETEGGRVAPVTSPLQVGRRLARAVGAAPPPGPFPASARVEHLGGPATR